MNKVAVIEAIATGYSACDHAFAYNEEAAVTILDHLVKAGFVVERMIQPLSENARELLRAIRQHGDRYHLSPEEVIAAGELLERRLIEISFQDDFTTGLCPQPTDAGWEFEL